MSIAAAVSFCLSMVVFGPIRGLWASSWGPGDMLSTYNNVDLWNGLWYQTTDTRGFPGEMNLNLFPGIDITQNSLAVLLGVLSPSPFLGLNLLIIVSFPMTAAATVLAFRLVGLTGLWAVVLSLAFTFIPYHWGRSLGHVYLGTTYAAVTGVALALLVAQGRLDRARRTTTLLAIGLVVVTAWSGVYYAAFGILVLLVALVWRGVTGASLAAIARNAWPLALMLALSALALIPAAIARTQESINNLGNRPPYESVELAGSLALALVPAPVSVLPYMGYYNEAAKELTAQAPNNEALALTNYGTWTSLAALAFAILWAFRRIRRGTPLPRDFRFLTLLGGVLLLFFVPWGLNSLFATYASAQIRAWNRLVPSLLLLTFLLAATAITASPRIRERAATFVGAGVVVTIVVVDQVVPYRALYSSTASRFAEDTRATRAYADLVNERIPEHCGVVQLPFMVYPENGLREPRLNDYDHLWQALLNPQKKWSYGAVRGTMSEQRVLEASTRAERGDVEYLRSIGACAVHVDSRGYTEDQLTDVARRLELAAGAPVAIGREGQWTLFDVRGSQDRS